MSEPPSDAFPDPPGPTDPEDPSCERTPTRRRWPRRVAVAAVVVLAGVAGALGWLAWDNAAHAEDWRSVAEHAEDELAATRADLHDAENDIDELERRVAELAAEKAQVAAERGFFQSQQEAFADLTIEANEAIDALGACLTAQRDTTVAALDLRPGEDSFDAALASFRSAADRADRVCGEAVAVANDFRGSLFDLLDQI